MKLLKKEKQIENEILTWLKNQGILCFKVETQGTFDRKKGIYRKNFSGHHMKGVSDIIGIYKGRFMAIEVKSKTGKTSEDQNTFLDRVKSEQGHATIARSIEEVEKWLNILKSKRL